MSPASPASSGFQETLASAFGLGTAGSESTGAATGSATSPSGSSAASGGEKSSTQNIPSASGNDTASSPGSSVTTTGDDGSAVSGSGSISGANNVSAILYRTTLGNALMGSGGTFALVANEASGSVSKQQSAQPPSVKGKADSRQADGTASAD
jgi:hypothetical protein